MTTQLSDPHRFFSRALESSLLKLDTQLQKSIATQDCEHETGLLFILQCGTVIAHALKYVQDSEYYLKLLAQLYALINKEEPKLEGIAQHVYHIHRLRFLTACTLHDISIAGGVTSAAEVFFQKTDSSYGIDNLPDFSTKRDFRTPNYINYDYLMLLVEMWQYLQDIDAYERLKRYCLLSLEGQSFYEINTRHRYIGFYSLLPAPLKELSRDILLQHIYRSNYLDPVIKNDPWRFLEQVCLYQTTFHDVAIFRFITAKLMQWIEKHYRSARYAFTEMIMEDTLSLTHGLLLYFRSTGEQPNAQKQILPDLGKSIWDTESILQITDGQLFPEKSKAKKYSMGTFIPDQMIPEYLFFATDDNWGKKYHHKYKSLTKPFSLGAGAVMTSHLPEKVSSTQQFLLVNNTFSAMLKLAIENRRRYRGKVIGITGSVGKTSTASMIHDILSCFGTPYKNLSKFNHQTGVPKSIANIPQESDYAILEMGMGQPGTILPKSVLARPHIVIVTEIQHDHMEFHDSINSVIETKLEIVDGLEPEGTVILNRDSRHYAYMLGILHAKGFFKIITFGEHPLADIRAILIKLFSDFSEIDVEMHGRVYRYRLSLPGMHMALNSLAVLAVLNVLELDIEKVLTQFKTLMPMKGRNEIFEISLEGKTIQIIDDSFNANPASMRSSFHILSLMTPNDNGRRIMIVGDMGELGRKTKKYHESLAEDVNHSKIDIFFSIGKYSRFLSDKIKNGIDHRHFDSSNELQDMLLKTLKNGDVVSFKGSAREGDIQEILKSITKTSSI